MSAASSEKKKGSKRARHDNASDLDGLANPSKKSKSSRPPKHHLKSIQSLRWINLKSVFQSLGKLEASNMCYQFSLGLQKNHKLHHETFKKCHKMASNYVKLQQGKMEDVATFQPFAGDAQCMHEDETKLLIECFKHNVLYEPPTPTANSVESLEEKQERHKTMNDKIAHLRHIVYVIPIHFNIQAALVLKQKRGGKPEDTYLNDFVKNVDNENFAEEFEVDGNVILRISPQENWGKPKESNDHYAHQILIKLPTEDENPITNPNATFDHTAEGKRWGNIIAKGLNNADWMYGDTYRKYPFEYGGLFDKYGEVACLDQVLLNGDIKNVVECLYDGEMPSFIMQETLDCIFSDQVANNPYSILNIEDPKQKGDNDEDDDDEEGEMNDFN